MKLLLFAALLVVAKAETECCSAEDAQVVQKMWSDIWSAEFTGRRIAVAQAVFADLFQENAGVIPLFDRVNGANTNSAEFRAHCVRVVNGLDTSINMLGYPEALNFQLAHLNKQHKARAGVLSAHFDAMADSFSDVMPQVSNCFKPDAWKQCFATITDGIREGLD